MLGNLISGFVVILVGTSLMPSVANAIYAANRGNVTGAASSLLGLTTTFYALAVMSAGVVIGVSALRQASIM
jgi:hypothetical protein